MTPQEFNAGTTAILAESALRRQEASDDLLAAQSALMRAAKEWARLSETSDYDARHAAYLRLEQAALGMASANRAWMEAMS